MAGYDFVNAIGLFLDWFEKTAEQLRRTVPTSSPKKQIETLLVVHKVVL